MRTFLTTWLTATLALTVGVSSTKAEIKAELVSAKMIWDQAPRNLDSDLVRFKDSWFVVLCESTGPYSQDDALRVLTSKDGAKWESVALIKSPTPKKGLHAPRFTLTPDGRLMVSAQGIVPSLGAKDPVPEYGGTVKAMAWFSKDGRTWADLHEIGKENYPFSRVVWHKGAAWSYGRGCICGSAQTVQFFSSKDGKKFTSQYEKTFSGFFPEGASMIADGDKLHCLMSRSDGGSTWRPGLLGTAKAPYTKWEWKELDARVSRPNLLRVSEKRIVAAVGLSDKKARTSLCELDLATGKLTEFYTLPTGGNAHAGLALHAGHLWVSYHALHKGKWSIHLAKVKTTLPARGKPRG